MSFSADVGDKKTVQEAVIIYDKEIHKRWRLAFVSKSIHHAIDLGPLLKRISELPQRAERLQKQRLFSKTQRNAYAAPKLILFCRVKASNRVQSMRIGAVSRDGQVRVHRDG